MKGTDDARRADFGEAEAVLRSTIARQPGFPGAHLTLAQLLYTTGRVPEAGAEFAAALALDPRSEDARRGLELCRQKLQAGKPGGPP
jgi:predicted Zn-dependent protease